MNGALPVTWDGIQLVRGNNLLMLVVDTDGPVVRYQLSNTGDFINTEHRCATEERLNSGWKLIYPIIPGSVYLWQTTVGAVLIEVVSLKIQTKPGDQWQVIVRRQGLEPEVWGIEKFLRKFNEGEFYPVPKVDQGDRVKWGGKEFEVTSVEDGLLTLQISETDFAELTKRNAISIE